MVSECSLSLTTYNRSCLDSVTPYQPKSVIRNTSHKFISFIGPIFDATPFWTITRACSTSYDNNLEGNRRGNLRTTI